MNATPRTILLWVLQLAAALSAAAALAAPTAAGQLVTFTSGKALEIDGYRMEGGVVLLSLRGGGEIGCLPSQIARIERRVSPPEAAPASGLPPSSSPVVTAPAAPSDTKPHVSPMDPAPGVKALIRDVAASLEVDAKLLEAIVRVESNYDPFAVSHRGAMGLMQLMPQTARRFQVGNVFDPAQNLEGGTRYLKELLARYREVPLALAAYNAGEDAVERHRGIPPFRETRAYVTRILRILRP